MATGIWGRRLLRALGIGTVVLAVLAGMGYAAKPWWQPWWYAKTLCGGNLSGGDLAALLPEERLQAGDDTFDSGSSLLKCGVNEGDGRHFVIKVESQTDVARSGLGPLAMEFTIPTDPHYVYSTAVPGFYGKFGPVIIQECPKIDRDDLGRKPRLVTNVYANGVEDAPSPQTARMAVQIANAANDELDCGAEPLPVPERVEPIQKLTLGQARNTMCGWLAGATLPKSPSGKAWQVTAPTDDRAPITSCTLVDSGTGEAAVHLTGWYGDWTDEPFERLLGANVKIPDGKSSDDALLSEHLGRAKARCAGESANFLARSYTPDHTRSALPTSDIRDLLNTFAADQAERRDCSGLKLPGPTAYPSAN